ncbi:ORF21 [Ranid herpesvirus 1]|uniref:ORF21 n=1 Tax=Ranid herpesvirus 1 TaxID=85655 RepID=Q14VT7_9VIRU|nr:ORF21 [Ranid herpesvirus 1]ABG25791.1 ORF21 [Ranid herpesvirus 1]
MTCLRPCLALCLFALAHSLSDQIVSTSPPCVCYPGFKVRINETGTCTCQVCEPGTYSTQATSSCLPCMLCDSARNLRETAPCRPDANSECGCMAGYAPVGPNNTCISVTCPAGEQTDSVGTCARCPPGSFKPADGIEACMPHTRCARLRLDTLMVGTALDDTKCGTPKRGAAYIKQLFGEMRAVLLFIGARREDARSVMRTTDRLLVTIRALMAAIESGSTP